MLSILVPSPRLPQALPFLALMVLTVLFSACATKTVNTPVSVLDFPTPKPGIAVTPPAPTTPINPPTLTPTSPNKAIVSPTRPNQPPLPSAGDGTPPVYGWPKAQRLPNIPDNIALIKQELGHGLAEDTATPATTPSVITPSAEDSTPTASTAPTTAPSATSAQGAVTFSWPSRGAILRPFGTEGLRGIEFGGKIGDPVFAAAEGTVTYTGTGLRGFGKLIVVKHSSNYLTVYAHNSALLVKEGQQVKRGEKIAELGDTDTNRPKLLFQMREGKNTIDPRKFLPAKQQ